MNRSIIGGLAAAALLVTSTPALAAPKCVTTAEFRAGAAFMIPGLLKGARAKCTPVLPKDSYLALHGDELAGRFQASDLTDSAALQSLVTKLKPNGDDIPNSANLSFANTMRDVLAAKLEKDLKPKSCQSIDRALALVDPLPAANWIGLLEIAVGEVVADNVRKGKKADFTFCDRSS